jgi:hypothetical protein
MKKILVAMILLSILGLNSCGKKGNLKYEGEQARPKFDGYYDEK